MQKAKNTSLCFVRKGMVGFSPPQLCVFANSAQSCSSSPELLELIDLCPGEDLRADQVLGGSREGAAGILAGDDRVTGQGECVKDKKVSAWQRGAPLSWQPQLSGRPSWCLGTACPPNPGDGNNDPNTKWLSSPEPCSESLMCSSPFKPHSNLAVGLITHLTGEETISAEPLAPGHWLVSEYPGLEGSNLMPAPPPHGRG